MREIENGNCFSKLGLLIVMHVTHNTIQYNTIKLYCPEPGNSFYVNYDRVRLSHISDARILFQDCLQCLIFLHISLFYVYF